MAEEDNKQGDLLDLSKGLHIDFHPVSQPPGTYRNLVNGIRIQSGAIETERGTEDIKFLNKTIIGGVVLDTDLILFLVPSEIGVLDINDNYLTITNRSDLNYQLNSQGRAFDAVAKKSNKGERLVYTVDGINPDRRINLDNTVELTSSTFLDDTKIQVNPSIPEITIDSIVDGGTLPTGVYQATARLLTRSTNPGPFGYVSPLVSIIDEADGVNYNQQDGALPQSPSPKAINFIINNVDPQYAFIEVAIVTYIGTANVSTAYLVATLPIDGRTTIPFTYSSVEQNKDSIDLSAISVKPIYYDHAKSIEQKDGILVRSNLTAIQENYNFQLIANLVKVKYFIEEIPWQPGYKNPILAALKRGYQRDEVYSLGIAPEFTTSYNTTAYHIPNTASSPTANTTTKELGVYSSLEIYPLNTGYPVSNVKHFRMPTLQQEPIIVLKGNVPYLRILGLEVDFTDALTLLPASVKKNLVGFNVVRQSRTSNNKSILTQGVANPHIKQNNVNYTFLSGFPNSIGTTGFFDQSTSILNEIGFMAPETTIYNDLPIGFLTLKTVGELVGTQTSVHDFRAHDQDQIANTEIFLDYSQVNPLSTTIGDVGITTNSAQYIPATPSGIQGPNLSNLLINGTNDTVNNYKNNGYLFLKLNSTLPSKQNSYNTSDGTHFNIPEFFYYYRGHTSTDRFYFNGVEQGIDGASNQGTSIRYLYNVVRTLDRQYGAIYDAKYIICGNFKLPDSSSNSPTTLQVFGGDTFIGKFSVVNQMAFAGGEDEVQFRVLSYFFCESMINVDYRHYSNPIGTEGQPNFIPGTLPYYPKLSILYNDPNDSSLTAGVLNFSWALGHSRGYNRQYSFESTLITLYPKSLEEDTITNFSNRSIYSDISVEGEQLDSYRVFLPNNYHDTPRDRGEIMDTFVFDNKFYTHTTGALYSEGFNDREFVNTDKSQVVIGNGGVFSRPSEPMKTVNGGYAGTQGKWGLSTPFGYFFIDARQKKVFLLTSQLEDLSGQGMDLFFSTIEETDNFSLVYDYKEGNNRFILTSSKGWTLSYQTKLKSWTGFHSYNPYYMISRGVNMYTIHSDRKTLLKLGNGPYGVFNSQYSPMRLLYSFNEAGEVTKSFDNIVLHTSTYDESTLQHKPFETFTNLRVYNELKDTNTLSLIVPQTYLDELSPIGINEVFAKRKNQEFRVAIPSDILLDINNPGVYTNTREFRPRMTGKWMLFDWTFNRIGRRFVLHTIKTKIRGVAR